MSRTGTRKENPRERGSIWWLQSGSTEARLVGALCIWQVQYSERNVDAGMLGCQGEGCACELEYHDRLLLACQEHRMISVPKMTFKRSQFLSPSLWPQVCNSVRKRDSTTVYRWKSYEIACVLVSGTRDLERGSKFFVRWLPAMHSSWAIHSFLA